MVVEVKNVDESRKVWSAEEYHQDYFDKNPGGYCHINLDSIDLKDRIIFFFISLLLATTTFKEL